MLVLGPSVKSIVRPAVVGPVAERIDVGLQFVVSVRQGLSSAELETSGRLGLFDAAMNPDPPSTSIPCTGIGA